MTSLNDSPVFFISKVNRKEAYRTTTTIYKSSESGELYVIKKASSAEGKQHVEKMFENYALINDVFDKKMLIVKPQNISIGLKFNYIHGKSLERTLVEKILELETEEVLKIIDKLYRFVDVQKTQIMNPNTNKDYSEVFGKTYDKTVSCIKPGLLDINFDNFVIDNKGKWNYFDYEWCFNFPIPKNYVKSRVLWFFIIRHQEIFKYVSNKLEVMLFDERLVIPRFIYDKYKEEIEGFTEMQKTERFFQTYVTGVNEVKDFINMKVFTHDKKIPFGIDNIIEQKVSEKTRRIDRTLKEKNEELLQTRNELDAIKHSRTYKAAMRISNIKNRVSNK